jgi:hypothetical protein
MFTSTNPSPPPSPGFGATRAVPTDVAQTFLSAGLRDILVPCFILTKEATGKSPEPAGWKACAT